MITETQLQQPKQAQIEAQTATATTELVPEIPYLTVIIPAMNEAAGIFRTLLELKQELQEFGGKSTTLVVDGHSADETGQDSPPTGRSGSGAGGGWER